MQLHYSLSVCYQLWGDEILSYVFSTLDVCSPGYLPPRFDPCCCQKSLAPWNENDCILVYRTGPYLECVELTLFSCGDDDPHHDHQLETGSDQQLDEASLLDDDEGRSSMTVCRLPWSHCRRNVSSPP